MKRDIYNYGYTQNCTFAELQGRFHQYILSEVEYDRYKMQQEAARIQQDRAVQYYRQLMAQPVAQTETTTQAGGFTLPQWHAGVFTRGR